uniref:Uncharacterized protein n=1 Tax=Oryza meridionalis TaxID=40149 RepID=A0A0E0DQP1_9ORYZ
MFGFSGTDRLIPKLCPPRLPLSGEADTSLRSPDPPPPPLRVRAKSWPALLLACAVHAASAVSGVSCDPSVEPSLLHAYGITPRFGTALADARSLLDGMPHKAIVCWSARSSRGILPTGTLRERGDSSWADSERRHRA